MNNIGYAIFGRPKGLQVVSNGLFKDLDIDNSLYLDPSKVTLSLGQQLVLIKRIQTSQDSAGKNGICIGMYEFADSFDEPRPGGCVGSAVLFKNYGPDSGKIVNDILPKLFSEAKKQVGTDGKFKNQDSNTWGNPLPDPARNLGLVAKEKLIYKPFLKSDKRVVIKVIKGNSSLGRKRSASDPWENNRGISSAG